MKVMMFAALIVASGAFAAAPTALPEELRNCASIKRNAERLACFDRAVAMLAAGKDAGALPAPTPEASFGMLTSERAPPAQETKDQRDDLQSVTSTVKGFGRSADGSLVIHLDNGQSWRQLSGTNPMLKPGDTVTINRAALGSFQMIVPSGRSSKVRRES
jgi:hypothetical protein